MYGLNGFAILLFAVINYFSVRLVKKGLLSKKVIYMLSIFLLLLNSIRYIFIYPFVSNVLKIPVEFSTVSYFTVPIIIICHFKKFYGFAAYSGLMAGFFYYLALIFLGGPIYSSYDVADVYISMICHGILYILGFYLISAQKCEKKDSFKIILGISGIISNAIIFRPVTEETNNLLIYFLLDATPVNALLHTEKTNIVLFIYYITVMLFVLISISVFFRMNKKVSAIYGTIARNTIKEKEKLPYQTKAESNMIL